jgi:hypothetical protein
VRAPVPITTVCHDQLQCLFKVKCVKYVHIRRVFGFGLGSELQKSARMGKGEAHWMQSLSDFLRGAGIRV